MVQRPGTDASVMWKSAQAGGATTRLDHCDHLRLESVVLVLTGTVEPRGDGRVSMSCSRLVIPEVNRSTIDVSTVCRMETCLQQNVPEEQDCCGGS